MLFNYTIGSSLNDNQYKIKFPKKKLLFFGIFANITLLGYFKYADFFIENVNLATNSSYELLHLALPLAISFFTFQQIAYLIDSYRFQTKEYDFLNYALFVTFFPQLIAGPIVHHKEMMPQFSSTWNLVKNHYHIALGSFIFFMGLFKKVVIADTFAIYATNGFDKAETLNMIEAWITSLSYTFQLYFDFSGYTDMAIGAALLFNIKLPINFFSPYKALDIQDFWRRWHITLSRFLRDYIYIPLGGNRFGHFHTYTNLMITFLIGGLWHGAGWTFVFWGVLHGFALVIHRIWRGLGITLHRYLAWFITFNFINISWIFFRANEWEDALKVLKGMFTGPFVIPSNPWFPNRIEIDFITISNSWLANIYADKYALWYLLLAFALVLIAKNSVEIMQSKFKTNFYYLFFFLFLSVSSFLNLSGVHEFLYFNF